MEFKQKSIKFLFPIFALIFLLVYFLACPYLQLKSYNIMNKLTMNNKKASDDVVLVVVDDESLEEIDRWPWKREYYLKIFDYFENYTNAKFIAYDGLVVAPDKKNPESDRKFFNKIGDFKKLTAGIEFSHNKFEKDIDKEYYNELLKTKNNVRIIDKRTKKQSKSPYESFSVLQKGYFNNINTIGGLNIPADNDGYIRKVSQVTSYNDILYPSMGLIVYSRNKGINELILNDKYLYSADYSLKIPIKNIEGSALNYICYYDTKDGTYSHKKYPAFKIIQAYDNLKKGKKPELNSEEFNNKFIFIGANAQAQGISDIQRTPVSEKFSGLDIQATNFDNLLTNTFYRTINPVYNFLICLIIFLLVFVFTNTLPIAPALFANIEIAGLYLVIVYLMYKNRIALDFILPEIFVVIALACSYSYKYLLEDTKKKKIQKAMGKYLSYDVMQNVVKNIDNISLGGKRADITVLFADIRNFTSISESMDPVNVSRILNEYFSAMVPIIESYGGTLNKFMGDAMLVIFGEPEKKHHNHALNAVRCGYDMLKKVKVLQEKWLEEGKPKIEIGIGISSGEAFIGNIGSQERLEYTVIGDTVNTASRIEIYNKIYKTNFLISETTFERVREHIDVIIIKDVMIRGKANRINLYEVVRLID